MLGPVLALDFGTKRIGVAQSFGTLAEPIGVWPYDEQFWQRLFEYVQEQHIEQIVVGESEGAMAELSRRFADQVATRTGLPVTLADETLSSVQATAKLKATQKYRPGQANRVDHLAAAEFLQEWLDTRAVLY
jgi:putative Holliday junction resolvase